MNTVRDIMNTKLVTVSPEATVHDLTRLLAEHDISGVPVVTEDGHVVGVVSTTDVIRLAAEGSDTGVAGPALDPMPMSSEIEDEEDGDLVDYFQGGHTTRLDVVSAAEWMEGGDPGEYRVREIMTPANFHIHPDASLAELARFLLRGRIHRALVMEGDRLTGIVTTVDVLRTVADGASQ